jgi:hypothetical protein
MKATFVLPLGCSDRAAGRSALGSGLTGLVACILLICAVVGRGSGALNQSQYVLMFDLHDAVSVLQFALLLPVVCRLFELSDPRAGEGGRGVLYVGVISVYLVVATLLLALPRVLSNGIYTVPQGVFGVWLVYMSWRMKTVFGWPLRGFGMVVGTGLLLFGLFLVGYVMLVSTMPLRSPAASVEEQESVPFDEANTFLHQFIWLGALMGVYPLPVWTVLVGAKLLRRPAGTNV